MVKYLRSIIMVLFIGLLIISCIKNNNLSDVDIIISKEENNNISDDKIIILEEITETAVVVAETNLSGINNNISEEKIIDIAVGNTHSMAIGENGNLWIWGENTFGQLGTGKQTLYPSYTGNIIENNNIYVPTRLLENIIGIAAGDGFSMAINSNNELFTWGRNDRGQLGNGTILQNNIPQKIMDDVVYIAAYRETAIAIKKDNTLWMWGSDVRSWRHRLDNIYLTSPVLLMNDVKKALVGYSCVLILDHNNNLYGFGNVLYLGINDRRPNSSIESPQLILTDIKDIAVTSQSIFALSYTSELFGWGVHSFLNFDGSGGFLGIGVSESWIYSPVLIQENVKKVFSGYMLIDNDDSLWIWGSISSVNDFRATVDGQGRDTGGSIIDSTMIVYGNTPVKIMGNITLACGNGFHNMAVDKDGNLYTWGNNQFGQLGNGKASVFEIKYFDNWTGEETAPGEGEPSLSFINDNSYFVPTRINILF